ncbi:MAG: hypothetical protein R3F19_18685 [Verrucomicrobiales bacterium]
MPNEVEKFIAQFKFQVAWKRLGTAVSNEIAASNKVHQPGDGVEEGTAGGRQPAVRAAERQESGI